MSLIRLTGAALPLLTVLCGCGSDPVRPTGPAGSSGPPVLSARGHSSLAYDPMRQRVLLYGGVPNNSNVVLEDLWSWDGATWSRIAETTGGGEFGAIMYATPAGVFRVTPRGVVARLAGTQWIPVSGATTPDRTVANLAYDTRRGRLVRYGGGDAPGTALPETWEFDGQSWTLASTEGPSARHFPAMAFDPTRGVTVLFGGQNLSREHLNDTWEWDGTSWTAVGSGGPSPRFGATMVFDEGAGAMLLFGGANLNTQFNDLWQRSGAVWSRVNLTGGPSTRTESNMVYDPVRRNVVLFGGDSAQGLWLGDTWTWDGTAWTAR